MGEELFPITLPAYPQCEKHSLDMHPTFRRCLQKNNISLAIVFGELLTNLQLLSQLKLWEIELETVNLGKMVENHGTFQKTFFNN